MTKKANIIFKEQKVTLPETAVPKVSDKAQANFSSFDKVLNNNPVL